MSYFDNGAQYKCSQCGRKFPITEIHYLCEDCGRNWQTGTPLTGVLETIFDYDLISEYLDTIEPDWSLLSAIDNLYFPNYPVGKTPFVYAQDLSNEHNLYIKFEGTNPSGSLKDRASFLVVAQALQFGNKEIVCASTGNAASALASVCAAARIKAIIYVPASAPRAKLVQMQLAGADVRKIDGSYNDAFAASIEHTKKHGTLNRNTSYHPLTIEGKKTVSFEIFQQNNFYNPDYIIVPVGDGVILAGVYKGFCDLFQIGVIDRLPCLISVQAESSDAVNRYIETGNYSDAENPTTLADSISVKTPANLYMAAKAIKQTQGLTVTVSDEEIFPAQKEMFRKTGIFAEPAASASMAAYTKLKSVLEPDSQVVLLVTGHGLKDIESIPDE
ncbi:MAG: threonine synthase [Candidatus Cloacimonetes bacterium]|nr:threonine synthase [Candidatus Cloacimonadota bacterium]